MTRPVPVSSRAVRQQPAGRTDHLAGVKDLLTSGLARACCHAGARPDCQVLASVRYGPAALCARCDQRRSTLGKGTPPVRLPDPYALLQIAAARDACGQAAAALRGAVAAARRAGHPWSAVAAILGGSRQAAQQRFAGAREQRRRRWRLTSPPGCGGSSSPRCGSSPPSC